jgi:hypothetical protein
MPGLAPWEALKPRHGRNFHRKTAFLANERGKDGMASGGPPRSAQRLPANQRAPEREERFVDVRPLVIADPETAELIQPRKGPLDDL